MNFTDFIRHQNFNFTPQRFGPRSAKYPIGQIASVIFLGLFSGRSFSQEVWNSGTYSGPATVNSAFTINTSSATAGNPMFLEVGALNTGGTTTISGQGTLFAGQYGSAPTWNNSGTINFSDDTSIQGLAEDLGGSNVDYALTNTGTMEKTGGTGTSLIVATVTNSGVISTQSGTLLLARGVALNNGSTLSGSGITAVNGNVMAGGTTTINSGATLLLTGGNSLSGTGTITGPGTVLWKDSSLTGNATINSSFTIDTSAATGGNRMFLEVGSLTTGGTTTISGQGTLFAGQYGSAPTWNNSGTINFSDDTSIQGLAENFGGSNVDYALTNTGTLEKTGGSGISTLAASVTNSATGIIAAESGTLAISGASINAGKINVSSGAAVRFDGGLTLNNGSSLTGAGTVSLSGSDTINGTTTLGSGTTLQFTGSNGLSGSGTLSGGTVLWKDGSITGGGGSTINSNITIDTSAATGGNWMFLEVGALNTGGTTTISGQGTLFAGQYGSAPTWNNSGTINFSDDTSIQGLAEDLGGSNVDYALTNTGTMEKTGGTGTSLIVATVTNSGVISTQSGTLLLARGVALNNGSTLSGSGITAVNGNVMAGGTTTINSGATLLLTGGNSLSGTGTITGPGTVLWKDSSLTGNATINSSFTIDTSAATGGNRMFLEVGSLTTGGTTTISGQGTLFAGQYGSAPTWNNSGTINFSDDTSIQGLAENFGGSNVDYALTNTGTLEKTGGSGISTLAASVTNSATGIIAAESGTLAISGASINAGKINVSSGAAVRFDGGLTLNNGSSLTGAGTVSLSGSDTINGTTTLGSGTTLQFTGSNGLSGSGTLSGGTVLWKDGSITGGGGSTINSNITIDTSAATGGNWMFLEVGALNTGGTTTISGQGTLFAGQYGSAPTWNNSGTINFSDDTSIQGLAENLGGSNVDYALTNTGTMEKTGGSGVSTLAAAVTNSANGTIMAQSGTLAISGASTNAGKINVSSGAALDFDGGLSNSGQVNIAKTGNLGVAGTYFQSATGKLTGEGTLTGNANLSGAIEAGNSGLTVTGNVTLNSDGALFFDVGSVNVLGNLSLSNSALHLGLSYGSDLMTAGTVLTLADYAGTQNGLFNYNGVAQQNGNIFSDGVNSFLINYGSSNGAITLTAQGATTINPTYTPPNAVPLAQATPNVPVYVQGSQQLSTPNTSASSVYIQNNSVLTLYAGDVLNAPDGLNILQGGTLQGSGTIVGNVVNSGLIHILLGTKVAASVAGTRGAAVINTGSAVVGGTTVSDSGWVSDLPGDRQNGGSFGGTLPDDKVFKLGDYSNAVGATTTFVNVGTVATLANAGTAIFDGKLTITGSLTQTATGTLEFDIRGYEKAVDYSFLQIGGSATVDGTILANLLDGFIPQPGALFDILQADGGITLADDINFNLPDGFTYRLINNNTILELVSTAQPQSTPEPSTWCLIAMGVSMLALISRRRNQLKSNS